MRKKNQITHATHSITLLSVFRVVFGVLYSGAFVVVFWHSPHSAMMLRESDNYDSLPGLDVFCGGLVITKLLLRSELKLDTKLSTRVRFAYL